MFFDGIGAGFVNKTTRKRHTFLGGSRSYSSDDYGADQLAKLAGAPPAAAPPRNLGTADWMLYFDVNVAAFIHRGTARRHLFWNDGRYASDTGGADQLTPVAGLPVQPVTFQSPDWLLYFDANIAALIHRPTFGRHHFWNNKAGYQFDGYGRDQLGG